MNTTRRVFCVGFNKTGTTAMKRCFQALCIQPIAPDASGVQRALFVRKDYGPALRFAEKFGIRTTDALHFLPEESRTVV